MKEKLKVIVENFIEEVKKAEKEADVLNVKAKYLGKKSELFEYFSKIKDMSIEDKKTFGPLFNKIKQDIEEKIERRIEEINSSSSVTFDETLPLDETCGSLHPVTIVAKEVLDIMEQMEFTALNGREMEDEFHNFEALNVPKNHPARDMQDTYYLDNGLLLRTQTSTDQIRAMEMYGAPLRIISPGRVFRNEDIDPSHENTFFQLEGMVIDENVSIGNLIYIMEGMLRKVFKQNVKVRLRPGYFPFTEPGFELDCSCTICGGKGCSTCKGSGWIELCPCGMVHPDVLRMGGIDTKKYNGFAFGVGLTRLAMMKYKIPDIRVFNSGDLRKVSQFNIE